MKKFTKFPIFIIKLLVIPIAKIAKIAYFFLQPLTNVEISTLTAVRNFSYFFSFFLQILQFDTFLVINTVSAMEFIL